MCNACKTASRSVCKDGTFSYVPCLNFRFEQSFYIYACVHVCARRSNVPFCTPHEAYAFLWGRWGGRRASFYLLINVLAGSSCLALSYAVLWPKGATWDSLLKSNDIVLIIWNGVSWTCFLNLGPRLCSDFCTLCLEIVHLHCGLFTKLSLSASSFLPCLRIAMVRIDLGETRLTAIRETPLAP